ncbi:rRNA-processing protein EBP2 [Sporothrix schenckii 1099-18]|uniref:rRNA-processing protein EBP2 n=1 Tax=Sporothrix schenckii 1099-18 TaxID=1397361 RepID=A0A0F2M3W0_SPOSC|nr:rRNA-processing protein EBP2 [Sporothrix schenckii 1099-18]KJR83764.1 rRNA-processing protein EBP2 [Sporothrix schenckii 1099-18]
MGRSKLRVALAAEKGTDFKKLKEKKKYKAHLKEKAKKVAHREEEGDDEDDEDEEDEEEDEERGALIDDEASESDGDEEDEEDEELGADFIAAMNDSDDSDSEVEMEEKIARPKTADKDAKTKKTKTTKAAADDDNKDEEDDEEDDENELAWSDVDEEERAGLVVRQRRTINNTAALTASLLRIRMFAPTDTSVPFQLHQSVTSAVPTTSHPDGTPMDMSDDKVREQALYAQSLAAAVEARRRLRKEGVPFSRPTDYFAEMLKDDGHMAQVKAKLVEAATAQKASAEARKQRDLKKFGKKVQVEKMQERAKEKKETLEKIKSLKRKRSEFGTASTHESDAFDVAIDKELSAGAGRGAKGGARGGAAGGGVNAKRQKKNEKYGFGGKKRHSKSGDALSSGDLSGFNARKMKAGGKPGRGRATATRPGKARRQAAASRR